MAGPKRSSGQKAIEAAQKRFEAPQSKLHREVKTSLAALAKSRKLLSEAFQYRASKRNDQAKNLDRQSLSEAETRLNTQRAETARLRKLKNEDLTTIAETLLKTAEGAVETQKQAAKLRKSVVNVEDGMDAKLFGWIDQLIAEAVNALSDDTAADRAIGIASGGMIVAGVLGGPVVVAASAAASAVLLGADMRDKIKNAKRKQDQDAARVETALVLIHGATDLAKRWLEIVQ